MSRFKRNDNGKPKKSRKGVGGRPSKYNGKVHPAMVYDLCIQTGYFLDDLAVAMGIPYGTLTTWWCDHPEFKESIKAGRDKYNTEHVENALLKRALGYEYSEVKTEEVTVRDQHRDGSASMRRIYDDYVSSDEWKEAVEIVHARDKGKCRRCKKKGVVVHHTSYDNWGKGDLSEINDCELVCTSCHNKAHKANEVEVPFWAKRDRQRHAGSNTIDIPAMKTTTTTKQVLPNITALIFWLVNRSSGRWDHIQNVKIDVDGKLESTSRFHVMDWSAIGSAVGIEKLEQLSNIFKSLPAGTAIPMDSAGSGKASGGK